MAKYTEEELLAVQEKAVAPQGTIIDAFNQMVEEVKAFQAQHEKAHVRFHNGDSFLDENGEERFYFTHRRRSSRHSETKSNVRRQKIKEQLQTDDDGWSTLVKPKKSFGEEAVSERDEFRKSFKETQVKVRPNNKNISSSKPADPRDVVDKTARAFNAFDALVSDSEDSE
ncbi:hypothetical protein BABINDRAFT_159155 [Babjeviella inositovora NRRL Y-12698]|uniref:Cap-associated protein CAF20 n=1 Tax=Babjeviella inositovora NRRL Y-12698 TaxID=984486 RepID=A0A1E3QY68_9ASCO|nr:uncharacterized protein BABINDRAFT_159155 [Babjeviella inositovora NRRL Y-12698]ODQ82603.1 hypothetical protein BABINDRAFT_159155 [Babjeviella inositovora NRRL Y-12698]